MSSNSNSRGIHSLLPQLIAGVLTALCVTLYRQLPTWLSSLTSSDMAAIGKVLGEEWIPRESELNANPNSEMTITFPVSYTTTQTQVMANFLPPEELKELTNRNLWDPNDDNTGIGHSFWLHPSKETANTIWKKLAWNIWSKQPKSLTENAVGYEYWTNIVSIHTPLDWHFDMDRYEWEQNGNASFPTFGAVYYGYPHDSFRGGYLEIMAGGLYEEWPSHVGGELERFRAEYNRLVVFNASKWHRVSPISFGEGFRVTFATNLWHRQPNTKNYGNRID